MDDIVKKYTLQDPILFAGVKRYELEFRSIKARDNVAVEKLRMKGAGDMEQIAKYLQLICKIVPEEIEEMSHRDFMAAGLIIGDFLETGLPTTKAM